MAALKAPWHKAFKLLIVHAPPCADVRSRPFAGGEQQRRSRDSISPGWNLDGTASRTGSSVCFCSCKAELFPIPCPAAGLRPGNICRSATGKCFEHRCKVPSHRPTADSFHQHCCSIDVPDLECADTAGSPYAVSYFPNIFLPRFVRKRGGLQSQTAPSV